MRKLALLVLLVLALAIANPVAVPKGLCNESGKASGDNYLRLEKHKQQMAEYDKKIAELEEKATKIRREREEMEKNRKLAHRFLGIIIPPLSYVFWLFRYCP